MLCCCALSRRDVVRLLAAGAAALLARGVKPEELVKILGGNFRRAFGEVTAV